MTPRAVLVGLPGTGKSTSGRRLAKVLAVPFADSDDLVEAATGRTVRAIFAESGEAAFRAAERDAIAAAMRDFDGVLSLGGGAVGDPATRDVLAGSGVPIVLLHAPPATLLARVGDGRTRPLLRADPAARLAALTVEREPVYESLATIRADTEGRSPGQVAAHIAARLHTVARAR